MRTPLLRHFISSYNNVLFMKTLLANLAPDELEGHNAKEYNRSLFPISLVPRPRPPPGKMGTRLLPFALLTLSSLTAKTEAYACAKIVYKHKARGRLRPRDEMLMNIIQTKETVYNYFIAQGVCCASIEAAAVHVALSLLQQLHLQIASPCIQPHHGATETTTSDWVSWRDIRVAS